MTAGTALSLWLRRGLRLSGRATRQEFWWGFAAMTLVLIVVALVTSRLGPLAMLGRLLWLAALVLLVTATVRRLHDIGRSGWWVLIPIGLGLVWLTIVSLTLAAVLAVRQDPLDDGTLAMVATVIYGAVLLIAMVWLAKPSDPNTNAWGPPAPQTSP